jgi:hypothetical protein
LLAFGYPQDEIQSRDLMFLSHGSDLNPFLASDLLRARYGPRRPR